MAAGRITSWQIDGENVEEETDFLIFIPKSKNITLLTEDCIVKLWSFQQSHHCKSWTGKKAEPQGTGPFKLWCWKKLLRVPWTARRSNQSILKKTNPGYSLDELRLKLKLQYFSHLMGTSDSLEKTLMLGDGQQKEKRVSEGEMTGWHQRCNAH